MQMIINHQSIIIFNSMTSRRKANRQLNNIKPGEVMRKLEYPRVLVDEQLLPSSLDLN